MNKSGNSSRRKKGSRRKGCKGKAAYPNRDAAIAAILQMETDGQIMPYSQRPYRCKFCKKYHTARKKWYLEKMKELMWKRVNLLTGSE